MDMDRFELNIDDVKCVARNAKILQKLIANAQD